MKIKALFHHGSKFIILAPSVNKVKNALKEIAGIKSISVIDSPESSKAEKHRFFYKFYYERDSGKELIIDFKGLRVIEVVHTCNKSRLKYL
jgi:adenylyl- and sulfurtransferase ThiI